MQVPSKYQNFLLNSRNHYNIFSIHQNGKKRVIEEPETDLKKFQRYLVNYYQNRMPFHPAAHGGIKGKSIFDNAEHHFKAKYILKVDIKSCYGYIKLRHIQDALYDLKFNMPDEHIEPCFIWSHSLNTEMLPTGAPTSPMMCNLALTPLDYEISRLLKNTNYIYSRYIDDLHISTDHNRDWRLIDQIKEIMYGFGFIPSKKKCKWLSVGKADSTIVTGVNIGHGTKVPRQFNRLLRAKLNNLAMSGEDLTPELKGCLAYVKSIDNQCYNKLLTYFNQRQEYGRTLKESQ